MQTENCQSLIGCSSSNGAALLKPQRAQALTRLHAWVIVAAVKIRLYIILLVLCLLLLACSGTSSLPFFGRSADPTATESPTAVVIPPDRKSVV